MITLYLVLFAIIGLGVLALVLIVFSYLKTNRRKPTLVLSPTLKQSAPPRSKLSPLRTEPVLTTDSTLTELGFGANEETEELIDESITAVEELDQPIPLHQTTPVKKDIIVLYLIAPPKQPYMGYELLQAVLAAGLRYGEMDIFHYYKQQADGEDKILFSLASAVEPGIFDMANIGSVSCVGLSIFMNPAGNNDPTETFELMIETAQQLVNDLGGQLCNKHRQPLTDTMVEEYRAYLQD